jgi:hypothetical protein
MAEWCMPIAALIQSMSGPLHARLAGRLTTVLMGLLFARGRQTYSRWLEAVAVGRDFKSHYYFLGSLGRKINWVAVALLRTIAMELVPGKRFVWAIDDSPTPRYGPHVEGAGIHHNPTPGPADAKHVYGHIWVVFAWALRHRWWGTIALPIRAKLYIRAQDRVSLSPTDRKEFAFKTKLQLAAELVEWAADWLRFLGKTLWVVVDGGYVKKEFLRRAAAAGATVVGRLRRDACLFALPKRSTSTAPKRGRPRKYGRRITLKDVAADQDGWSEVTVTVYGKTVGKWIQTFHALYPLTGGLIRVVLISEASGWLPLLCTDPDATAEQIIEAYADRAAIEQTFKDLKEVHGWGKPQLRNVWANLAATNLACWLYTVIELWAWKRAPSRLVDRSSRPWDKADRRPSHADRKSALRRDMLREQFRASQSKTPIPQKIRRLFKSLFLLAN